MTKKAILVVSFGTTHLDTLNKTIAVIEENINNTYPDYRIYRAFTSKMIIKKLKNENILNVDTVCEAMERMISDGISDLIVQPTHIINGLENDLMTDDVNKYHNFFNTIKISTPLLTDTDDYFKVANVIADEYIKDKDSALVLMGHGTSHYSNCAYPALDYYFKKCGHNNVFVGTVEGYPTLEAVKASINQEYKNIILAPFMLVAGDHAKNDMAGDEDDSWKQLLLSDGYNVTAIIKGLGELQGIQDIFLEHLSLCMPDKSCCSC